MICIINNIYIYIYIIYIYYIYILHIYIYIHMTWVFGMQTQNLQPNHVWHSYMSTICCFIMSGSWIMFTLLLVALALLLQVKVKMEVDDPSIGNSGGAASSSTGVADEAETKKEEKGEDNLPQLDEVLWLGIPKNNEHKQTLDS